MLLLLLLVLFSHCTGSRELRCIGKEREALVRFKQGLIDEDGILSSWGNEEDKRQCCKWKGVTCSNETGHVTGLHLSCEKCHTPLKGKINTALLELNYLNHLDLSHNDFRSEKIPEFIGSLQRLHHLILQNMGFYGGVPHQLGNLTNLKSLNLGYNDLTIENLDWLSYLSSLSLLDLSYSNLRDTNLLQDILNLPSLTELYLRNCQSTPTYFFVNSSSTTLRVLDLSNSGLTSSLFRWLFNVSTSLRKIDMSNNDLSVIPDMFGRFTFLEYLDMSETQLTGGIPTSLGNLSYLQTLSLSGNNLSEPLPELFHKLSMGATKESLEILNLDNNELYGSLPDFTVFSSLRFLRLNDNRLSGSFSGNFKQHSRLEHLNLATNQITGSVPDMRALVSLKELRLSGNKLKMVPTSLGLLSNLEILDLSFNSFEGTISKFHFSKHQNLKVLDLAFNSLVLNFTSDWIPPFQLQDIRLGHCKMGPRFPTWLQTQTNFSKLDLSSGGISDEVPKWLWDLSSRITYLNLSYNQISGTIPDLSSNFVGTPTIDISSNNFTGHVPLFHPMSQIIQLSDNMFVGSISSICKIAHELLLVLDLSNNQFSGDLPDCWDNMAGLYMLNLVNNDFSGNIPHSLGSLLQLQTLHLRDNNFFGELPSTLKNCQALQMIDVGGNELTGTIPAWIGTHLKLLTVISLRHNNFSGTIPPEICYLTEIQILDLSRNSISGRVPQCFNNFTSLVQKNKTSLSTILDISLVSAGDHASYEFANYLGHALVQWKGQESEYSKTIGLLKLIDLSSNLLVGNIPHEFSHLRALISLNLSRNYLSGNIITNIGHMEMLESLDLSRNQFYGEIPISFAKLYFLSVLDLSNNNLSGKIPSSAQLQGFNASVYAGNSELCGRPLASCPGDGPNPPITNYEKRGNVDEEDDGFITHGFYISIVLGFVLGFWGAAGTLLLNKSWTNACVNFFVRVKDWLFVTTTIYGWRFKEQLRRFLVGLTRFGV